MVYNSFQKLPESQQYTCSSHGLFMGNEAYSLAAISFFLVPVIFLCFLFAFAPNPDSPRIDEIGVRVNSIRHRHRRERPKTSNRTDLSTRLQIYLRKNKFATLYTKCLIVSFLLIFWSMHHSINIAAFIKPTAVVNQFNNAAILSFGSMISLLSPLLLKVFAKKRLKLSNVEINAVFEEIRESAASEEFRESTGKFRGSTASKQFRKMDRSEDFKESVASVEFSESTTSAEFSENVSTFEEIRVRDIRRPASCPLDVMNVNKKVFRENYDSEEFRESVDFEEFRKSADSEKFSKSAVLEEFRVNASADAAVVQFCESLDTLIPACENLNQQHIKIIKRNTTVLEMMRKSFELFSALPEERVEEDN